MSPAATDSTPIRAPTTHGPGEAEVSRRHVHNPRTGRGRSLPPTRPQPTDRERPKSPADTSTTHQAALDTIADMRELVIHRRADQDANVELLRGVLRRPVIHPEHDARDLLAAASAKFDTLADATDNLHERGFWARAQEQTARYAATLAYVRTLEEGIPQSWEHVHYTRPEVDQAEAVITWHGELIRSYAVQAASEKVTHQQSYDVAIVVSQDADLNPAVAMAKQVAQNQNRTVDFESAFPLVPGRRLLTFQMFTPDDICTHIWFKCYFWFN